MPWRGVVFLLLVGAMTTGCLSPEVTSRSMMERLRAVSGPLGGDVLVMDVAIIEQPPGDPFIDHDIWQAIDEQAVALDRKAALDNNGLRVGVVGGLPPGKLLALLYNTRSCPDPHRITTRSGNNKTISIGNSIPNCQFDIRIDGNERSMALANAQGGLTVIPHRTPDGKIRLSFTPQVQHGNRALTIQPTEGEGWSLAGTRPTEKFASLSFDVTISPQEYVLIGGQFERERSFGRTLFVGMANDKPIQRLLIIRSRAQGESAPAEWTWMNDERRAAPLAFQASRTSRGYRD